jgi:predicted acyl esterase
MYPTSVLLRKGHRIRVALAGADASFLSGTPQKEHPSLTVYREAPSYLDLPVKTHNP